MIEIFLFVKTDILFSLFCHSISLYFCWKLLLIILHSGSQPFFIGNTFFCNRDWKKTCDTQMCLNTMFEKKWSITYFLNKVRTRATYVYTKLRTCNGLNVVYLLLDDKQYRTCERSQECSLQWEGWTLIQFKSSRIS